MKKWKSSKGLKIFMAVLSVLMVIVMAVSAGAVIFMVNNGIYSKPRKTILKDAYDRYSYIYSVMAVANRDSEGMKEELNKTNFRYGIIKTEDLAQIDISEPGNYLYYNFETMPASNALKEEKAGVYSFHVGPGVNYNWDCRLFGSAGVWDTGTEITQVELEEEEIIGLYYNTADGVFYYETPNGFFRIQTVELPLSKTGDLLTFEYDSGQKAYYNTTPSICLVQDYYVTFNQFDGTDAPWQTWNNICLNGIEYTHTDIRFITDEHGDSNTIQGKPIVEKYYTYDGGSNIVIRTENISGESVPADQVREQYHVVYQVREPLKASGLHYYGDIFGGDLYEQVTTLINLCWRLQYAVIIVLVLSAFLWGLSTVLLLIMAGHKGSYETVEIPAGRRKEYLPEEQEEEAVSEEEIYQRDGQPMRTERRFVDKITTGFWQKIPFDLETVLAFLAEGALIVLLGEAARDIVFPRTFILSLLICLVGYIIGLIWLTDFAVRIKAGKWWRGTLIYMVLAWIGSQLGKYCRKAVQFFRENTSLVGKTLGILFVMCVIEFLGIVMTGHAPGTEVFLWAVYRAVTVVLVLLVMVQAKQLKEAAQKLAAGNLQEKVKTEKMFWEFKKHGETLNSISDGLNAAVEKRMQSEHFRTELITNVSHDIKTPLTSIINYVDLLQKENIENDNAKEYLEVLSRQSARLKKLTEDLVEASKASTGSMPVNMEKLELGVFLTQTLGEFKEKLEEAGLRIVMHKPEREVSVNADGRHLWRVVENLIQNICKYAQPSTRVYIDLEETEKEAVISFKNISGYELNISGDDLMERFVRGDASRHTEGSGLGLSIAGSLMELMGGRLEIVVDGDLFKVILHFRKEG